MANHKKTPLPEAPPLAIPQPGNGHEKVQVLVTDAIDETTGAIVKNIDHLIKVLEAMKAHIVNNGAAAKAAIERHCVVGAEAVAFAGNVKDRLNTLMEAADDAVAAVNAEQPPADGENYYQNEEERTIT